jgi:hypothetical protein
MPAVTLRRYEQDFQARNCEFHDPVARLPPSVYGVAVRRLVLGLAAATAAALAIAAVALADKEKVAYTSAGQAAARAAVITKADLGTPTGWTGGFVKPDVNSGTGCPNFNPKQSDLTLIGAAETDWKHSGLEFDSEAQVLKTPAMVRLDWQRTVLSKQVLPCLRSRLTKALKGKGQLVSVRVVPFPKTGDYTRLIRTLVDYTTNSGTARIMVDELLVGKGATEISVTTSAAAADAASVQAAEARLAKALVGRIVL